MHMIFEEVNQTIVSLYTAPCVRSYTYPAPFFLPSILPINRRQHRQIVESTALDSMQIQTVRGIHHATHRECAFLDATKPRLPIVWILDRLLVGPNTLFRLVSPETLSDARHLGRILKRFSGAEVGYHCRIATRKGVNFVLHRAIS